MATDPLAQAVMVAYCGWDPTTPVVGETLNLDGNDTTLLALPSLYVTAVTAVTVTDQLGNAYTATVDQPGVAVSGGSDVGWSEDGCLIWHPWVNCDYSVWPAGEQNIAVTYSGGYDGPPDDLQAALDNLTSRMSGIGATSKRLGTAAVTYGQVVAQGGLLLVEQMVLDRYRLPRVA